MNYAELITALSQRLRITKAEAGKRMDETTAIIIEELAKNNVVSILNFGTLEAKKRFERVSVHPTTGKKMLVPPKMVVKYKPSVSFNKKLKEFKP